MALLHCVTQVRLLLLERNGPCHGAARRSEEVLRTAGVMMEAALSMRSYTVGQVRPHLRVVEDEFLPQSVPAYGATEIMNQLRKKYPDYAYKEAALNPTNPRNRAVDWESALALPVSVILKPYTHATRSLSVTEALL